MNHSITSLMCLLRATAFATACCTAPLSMAQQASKVAQELFFQSMVGTWRSEGVLKGADGQPVPIKQEWKGQFSGESEFIIEGTRAVNEAPAEKYRWFFTHNATTDLFEGVMTNPEDVKNAIRFEGNVSAAPLSIELRAQLGAGAGSMIIVQRFSSDRDSIESKVTLLNDAGAVNLEGVLTHHRVKP